MIKKYLEGKDFLHKGISFTLSLSNIMLLDLQIEELLFLIPLINMTTHICFIYFQEITHSHEINKCLVIELTSSLFEIQFTLFNPSEMDN